MGAAGRRSGDEKAAEKAAALMGRPPVARSFPKSSAIDRAVYDPESRVLDLCYKEGDRYSYFGVPEALFEALCAAPSAGAFVNRYVKPHFRHEIEPGRKRFRPKEDDS